MFKSRKRQWMRVVKTVPNTVRELLMFLFKINYIIYASKNRMQSYDPACFVFQNSYVALLPK